MRQRTDYIIIHCSATPPNMDVNAKEIDRWHRQKGWLGIGYHYVIKRDGTREVGRKLSEAGAHCIAYNHKSVGICLVGGVGSKCPHCGGIVTSAGSWMVNCPGCKQVEPGKAENNFTKEQFTTLRLTIGELTAQYKDAFVVGHRDLQSGKECPSFDVKTWLESVKSEQV